MNSFERYQDEWLSAAEDLCLERRLPNSYIEKVENHFLPLSSELALLHDRLKQRNSAASLVLGVQGTQGSGKSTASDFIRLLLEQCHGLRVVVLSIDDFYLGQEQRRLLSEKVHPLLKTRGVPGTHDIDSAIDTINKLKCLEGKETLALPAFDKATDDTVPLADRPVVHGPVDVVILEGWCVGLTPEIGSVLQSPVNSLEENEDTLKLWRHYVNGKLAAEYQLLFHKLDFLVVLQAPSFDCVFNWRLKQEQKLREKHAALSSDSASSSNNKIMTDAEVERFISHYQRLTEHALRVMPGKANWCFFLNEFQDVTTVTQS